MENSRSSTMFKIFHRFHGPRCVGVSCGLDPSRTVSLNETELSNGSHKMPFVPVYTHVMPDETPSCGHDAKVNAGPSPPTNGATPRQTNNMCYIGDNTMPGSVQMGQ